MDIAICLLGVRVTYVSHLPLWRYFGYPYCFSFRFQASCNIHGWHWDHRNKGRTD